MSEYSGSALNENCAFIDSSGKRKMEANNLKPKTPDIVKSLALLAVKHHIYVADLYQALGLARDNGEAQCGDLSIIYRCTINKEAIFLITKEDKIVIQFRVEERYLHKKDLGFESWMNTDKIQKEITKQDKKVPFITSIQNLRHGMKKITIKAEVVEIQKPQLIRTQFGTTIMLTNAVIADETGKVGLCLWGEHPNTATKGDTIQIKNASVRTYQGEIKLNLGQNGKIEVIQKES